jgi:probable HAF family extracellular repeat protein
MKSRASTGISAMTLLAVLTIPVGLAAQEQKPSKQPTRYKLVDLGTFGGPASYFNNGADGILNNRGTAAGWADTSTPDPYPTACFNPDCFVSHAFQSQNGVVKQLGGLAPGWSSAAFWISGSGLIAGWSQNGAIDPLVPIPEIHGVLWKNGDITDLGTLDGGYDSFATAVNNSGQVAGGALNLVSDPFCLFAPGFCVTQTRAFLWREGVMHDLGTLGGPDAIANFVNERGQAAGSSYTSYAPNSDNGTCPPGVPTQDPFFWEKGQMIDVGTLGGTCGLPLAFNNRGQLAGQSSLAGNLTFHPFIWSKSQGIRDLGTLGGDTGTTEWISDAGEVLGKADLPGPQPQTHDAVLWKGDSITDLGTLPGDSCSLAYQINSRGQIVGTSEPLSFCPGPCTVNCAGVHAFLWENGGPMVNLNDLIAPGSSLQLTYAVAINNRGEIAGYGVPPGCSLADYGTCGHAYVLIPCSEGDAACGDSAAKPLANTSPAVVPEHVSKAPQAKHPFSPFGPRFRTPE